MLELSIKTKTMIKFNEIEITSALINHSIFILVYT